DFVLYNKAERCMRDANGLFVCSIDVDGNSNQGQLKVAKDDMGQVIANVKDFQKYKRDFYEKDRENYLQSGIQEGSVDETTYKAEDSLTQVKRFGVNKGFVSGKMMGAVISFNPETGEIKVDRTNSHFQGVIAKVMRNRHLTKEAAEQRVIGHIKESLCQKEYEKRSASLTKDEAKMNVLMSKANDKLQYINQQITFILEREQAILTLKETFKKIEVPITDIFGKDSTTAGRAMVAAMVKNNQQSKYNEGMQDTYLTGKILASFKALQEILQRVYVDPKVVDAVEGVLKLSSNNSVNSLTVNR
ncbi:MAG: hypothetical protein WCH76_07695, partial [Candidatus Riflemargulisbacteria bacterium]